VSLLAFFVRRLLWTIPLVLLVMLATFALMRGSGGDPFNPPEGFAPLPTPLQEQLRDYYNLDSPWIVEFGTYVRNVATLDFGPSLVLRGVTVDDVIAQSFPITLELIAFAAALALPIGLALGLLAALRRNSVSDLLATSTASVLLVIPVFFVAYVLSRYPIFRWHIVGGGWDGVAPKILPSLSLALAPTGYVARLIRATVVETLEEGYVRTARGKGLRFHRIVLVHTLRNSLSPLVAAVVPMLALLVTGAFFVEQFFMIPGASTFFLQAAQTRDYPMLLGLTVAMTVLILLANLLADTLLMALDPRLREHA
jgi:ABC-type dipeptide/oligopeptide/nickel transport system permease component